MEDIKKINQLIINLRESLKDMERMSHTEYAEIVNQTSSDKHNIAFLIDRFDTDKEIIREILEDFVDNVYEHNRLVISKLEVLEEMKIMFADLKETKIKLETREKMSQETNQGINISNNNTASNGAAPSSKSSAGGIDKFINSTSGKAIMILVLMAILLQMGVTPDAIIGVIGGK